MPCFHSSIALASWPGTAFPLPQLPYRNLHNDHGQNVLKLCASLIFPELRVGPFENVQP